MTWRLANPIKPSPNLLLAEEKITKGRKKRQKKKGKKKKQSFFDSPHLDSKRNTHWLAYSSTSVGNRFGVFIEGLFFVFSSFASFVFFMFAAGCLGFFFFCFWRGVCSLLLVFYSSFWLNFSLVVHLYS